MREDSGRVRLRYRRLPGDLPPLPGAPYWPPQPPADTVMHCSVYKGRRSPDTYLFLPVRDDFSAVPAAVLQALGQPVHVMDLVLTPARPLARAEPHTVMRTMLIRGCYVQLPPKQADGE